MTNRFLIISYLCLCLTVAGLFGLSWHLNRSQYATAIQSVKADLHKALNDDIGLVRNYIRKRERETFALMDRRDLPMAVTLSKRLFLVRESKVFPAGLADLKPGAELDPETAGKAYEFGLETMAVGNKEKALEYFRTAGKTSVRNGNDLHRKASAYLNVLKLKNYQDRRALFHLLYVLFEEHVVKPDNSIMEFFENALRGNVAGYELEKNTSRELWRQAGAIAEKIQGQYRMALR